MSEEVKKRLINILMAILTVIGLALIFNEQIKSFIVDHMQEQALEQPLNHDHNHGDFDASNVKAVTPQDILKASLKKSEGAIGKIAIPYVGLKLPIFYGMDQNNMLRGACTMRPNEKMGMQGNYTLAGHHMMDNQILFGPLQNVKKGNLIFLTNGSKVYTYTITSTQVVSEYQTQWIDNSPKGHYLTLVTCASGHVGETRRIIVRGALTSVQKVNHENLKEFEK